MNDNETLLDVRDLKTQFYTDRGAVRAVDGVSFDVKRGEIVGLVGESGAGKSVTTSSIMRLIEEPGEVVGGEVRYMDRTLVGFEEGQPDEEGRPELVPRDETLSEAEMRTEIRGNEIAIIFQDPMESLNPVYTVGGQVKEFMQLNRDLGEEEAREEAVEMLRRVGIPEAE
ncbi:MAG: ATP-binding cassette domain-containing protein, partial [Halalkalicoccus sp.]